MLEEEMIINTYVFQIFFDSSSKFKTNTNFILLKYSILALNVDEGEFHLANEEVFSVGKSSCHHFCKDRIF